jgi:hypothetical protein
VSYNHRIFLTCTETQRLFNISCTLFFSFHFPSGPILSAKTGVRTVDCGMVSLTNDESLTEMRVRMSTDDYIFHELSFLLTCEKKPQLSMHSCREAMGVVDCKYSTLTYICSVLLLIPLQF